MDAAMLVRASRARSGLSKYAFAATVGTSRSALDQIEKGERVPGLDLVNRIAAVGGQQLSFTALTADTCVDSTLADHVDGLDVDDPVWNWRWLTAGFTANSFVPASSDERSAMLASEPSTTGSEPWDRFVAALAEHLSVHAAVPAPTWLDTSVVDHGAFWWPVHGGRPSTRAAATAHSPASFARRGILVDGRELPRVVP